jgi:hypothetical protein
MDAQQLTEAIVQATTVTHDPTATAQRRAEAVQFFEQVGAMNNVWLYTKLPHRGAATPHSSSSNAHQQLQL